ncbi:MAG TPA: hypothetical protein VJ692_13965 [Nitrospiraceae bacterium]|nr:hypothetical protein [Nitrospiraceae bacterium]
MPIHRTYTKSWDLPKAISREKGKKLFEREVRKVTHLSTEEFIEKWENGELPDRSDYVRLSMMIPLGR